MAYTAEDLVAIARAEVGYLEKKTNARLDSKTANAGSNNFTKYARDLHGAGYYQASKQGCAWCDMFVDWCHWVAAGRDADEAQRVICQTGPYGAGCGYSAQYYKNAGSFHTTPEVGDQIFFYNAAKTKIAHTGIVRAVDKTYVYTVEGNTSGTSGVVANGGGVFEKKYKLTYGRIYGYGRPRYGAQTAEGKVTVPVLRRGAGGEAVRAMQALLCYRGFTCDTDGSFGPATQEQLLAFQRAVGLEPDGICGPATWPALVGVGA